MNKLLASLFVTIQFLFVVGVYMLPIQQVAAQQQNPGSETSPPGSETPDPGVKNDSNQAIKTNPESVIGPIGSGKPGERCRVPVDLDKEKIIDNLDFDIPYVPGWLEGAFFKTFGKILGDSDTLFGELEGSLNGEGISPCIEGAEPSTEDPNEIANGNCICNEAAAFTQADDLCIQISDPDEITKCQECSEKGVWTAVGCVEYDFSAFLTNILFRLGVGIGGLIALGCIVISAITLQVSRGEPDKIQSARERMTSCIIGLLLIIFSIFILELIGVGILNLGQFGAPFGS